MKHKKKTFNMILSISKQMFTCLADKLSAETVCSKDSMSGLAPSVVAWGKLGVELAFRLDETRGVERTPPDDLN
jgi:hypothetical protein